MVAGKGEIVNFLSFNEILSSNRNFDWSLVRNGLISQKTSKPKILVVNFRTYFDHCVLLASCTYSKILENSNCFLHLETYSLNQRAELGYVFSFGRGVKPRICFLIFCLHKKLLFLEIDEVNIFMSYQYECGKREISLLKIYKVRRVKINLQRLLTII